MENGTSEIRNCAFLRMDSSRGAFRQDILVVEGRGQEARRLLTAKGFRRLRFRAETCHVGWPDYVAFICTVSKWRLKAFLAAMRELESNMLIMGYRDYIDACDAIFDAIFIKVDTESIRPLREVRPDKQ